MLEVDDINFIRYLHFSEGWSARKIASTFKRSRKTIRKYLNRENPLEVPMYHGGPRQKPKLGGYVDVVKQWLKDDEEAPRKQRHTARRIWERLTDECGAQVSESSVRRLVREIRPKQAFVPLAFSLGEMAQVDWGEDWVEWDGELRAVQVFYIRLAVSGAAFAMAFPRQIEEAFLEGHVRGLEFLGGVPRKILYDNLKAATVQLIGWRGRKLQPDFARLVTHYVFEPVFANPGAGNEKGLVENLVKWGHRHLFTPVPRVSSWEELNGQLIERCLSRRKAKNGATSIGELWDEERRHLIPLPPVAFPPCKQVWALADKCLLVRYRGARYSVPRELAQRRVRLRVFWDRLEVIHGAQVAATHQRQGKGGSSLLLEHYLDVFRDKPGAVRHAAVLRQYPPLAGFRDEFLRRYPDRYRELASILQLYPTHGLHDLVNALKQAAAVNSYSLLTVKAFLTSPVGPGSGMGEGDTRLADFKVWRPELSPYDRLARGEAL